MLLRYSQIDVCLERGIRGIAVVPCCFFLCKILHIWLSGGRRSIFSQEIGFFYPLIDAGMVAGCASRVSEGIVGSYLLFCNVLSTVCAVDLSEVLSRSPDLPCFLTHHLLDGTCFLEALPMHASG